MYLLEEMILQDIPKAVEYLTAAAEKGHPYAQYALGKLYLTGDAVMQNKKQATYWLAQSAAQGSQYAQFLLDHQKE